MIIEVQYTQYVSVHVDDVCESFDIKPENVKSLYVKWNTLYITTNDGKEFEYELNYDLSGDLKRPCAVVLRDDEYGRIKDSIQHCDNPFSTSTQEDQD
jgi:hypothetical protein